VSLNVKVLTSSFVIGALIVTVGLLAVHMSLTLQRSSRAILAENVSSLKAAEELEIALLDQKGIVGSYLLNGEARWLRLLEEKRQKFTEWFAKAKDVAITQHERDILQQIGTRYQEYDRLRYQAIWLYQQGHRLAAQQLLLNRVKESVDQLYQDCEELLFVNEQLIVESQRTSERKLAWFQGVLWSCITLAIFLGLLAGWLVSKGVARQLVQAEKLASLGQMAGLVAHEVRNPLTAIKMRVHSLQHELEASVSSQDDIEVIRQEIERLERIVNNFLQLAKQPEPKPQRISITETVTRALNVLEPSLEEHGIQVETRYAEPLPVVQADAEQLEQVILNLLLNAVQAMPEGGTIRIAAEWLRGRHETGGQVEITVSDTGPGIPPDLREKAFDPFFTTKADGSGLGLPLVKKIVELHHGSITIQPDKGAGTTMTIRLPAGKPEVAFA